MAESSELKFVFNCEKWANCSCSTSKACDCGDSCTCGTISISDFNKTVEEQCPLSDCQCGLGCRCGKGHCGCGGSTQKTKEQWIELVNMLKDGTAKCACPRESGGKCKCRGDCTCEGNCCSDVEA